jgi:16S rRNA (guanine527-N7)-methyltransferase
VGERLEALIADGAEALGVSLPVGCLAKFGAHYALLAEKNAVMNLTAVEGEEGAARLLFLDSLALLAPPTAVPDGACLLDIGSGAGFPGLVLAVARPDLSVTLLDAREKRAGFLRDAIRTLGLANAVSVCARAEDFAETRRASFDIVTARAVARLGELCELAQPLLAPGGALIAPKSLGSDEEIAGARSAASALGGEIEAVREYALPGAEEPRRAVVVRQTGACPARYPRRRAAMLRRPL